MHDNIVFSKEYISVIIEILKKMYVFFKNLCRDQFSGIAL